MKRVQNFWTGLLRAQPGSSSSKLDQLNRQQFEQFLNTEIPIMQLFIHSLKPCFMTNSVKLIPCILLLLAAFFATPALQAQSNAEKLPGLMQKNGSYMFTALKMSSEDQTALLNLLNKENGNAYNLSVNTARKDQNYGRLGGVNLKVKEIAGNKITNQASTTCHSVSTNNNCYTINTIVDFKALSSGTQDQVKSLLGKYLK